MITIKPVRQVKWWYTNCLGMLVYFNTEHSLTTDLYKFLNTRYNIWLQTAIID